MIDQGTLQQILDAAEIADVVGDFVTLKRRGTSLIGMKSECLNTGAREQARVRRDQTVMLTASGRPPHPVRIAVPVGAGFTCPQRAARRSEPLDGRHPRRHAPCAGARPVRSAPIQPDRYVFRRLRSELGMCYR